MPDAIAQFTHAKYLNLQSFRKTGVAVRTPVWFAQDPEHQTVFYIYSTSDAGKVKRIRNNANVRIAPCDFRGNLRGAWVDAHARLCAGDEAVHGQQLLRRKYWLKVMGDFFSRMLGRTQVVIAIEVAGF